MINVDVDVDNLSNIFHLQWKVVRSSERNGRIRVLDLCLGLRFHQAKNQKLWFLSLPG